MSSDLNIDVAIKAEGQKVILKFSDAIDTWVLDPQNTLDIAEAMAKSAFEARGDMVVPSDALKTELAEKAANVLVPRVKIMLKSLRNKPTDYQASQIVATCLSEVL